MALGRQIGERRARKRLEVAREVPINMAGVQKSVAPKERKMTL
jgi:hypothetical protein